jgi:DNA-binding NarL/FixJ family response regulator
MSITVLIVDDHPMVRAGIRAVLEREVDLRVVGEASEGSEALLMLERLRPTVVLIDLVLPGIGGMEVLRQLSQRAPGTFAMVLSLYAEDGYVREAVRAGARGYLLKDIEGAELVQAVRKVAAGERYFSATIEERATVANPLAGSDGSKESEEGPATPESLTAREREVLELAARGMTSVEIARTLYLSRRTVETHRSNLMRKLGLRGQTDLVRYALRMGIVRMGD